LHYNEKIVVIEHCDTFFASLMASYSWLNETTIATTTHFYEAYIIFFLISKTT